jgi:hypothetical protein
MKAVGHFQFRIRCHVHIEMPRVLLD